MKGTYVRVAIVWVLTLAALYAFQWYFTTLSMRTVDWLVVVVVPGLGRRRRPAPGTEIEETSKIICSPGAACRGGWSACR